ncbi:MAG TPA: hydrolase TatD [Lachnospiraceae bacterium]|nr:hydrolase TatD [Lachnospiraceae bacterium]
MIFETHAHYGDDQFNNDRHELLMSMAENGIGNIVEVGAGVNSTKDAIALSEKYDFIYSAVGIHPSETADIDESIIEWLLSLSSKKKVVAIGEIGLDYHYNEPERNIQKKWFKRQLALAKEAGLPVIIHSRDAAEDTLDIIKSDCAIENGGVIHCFSYSWEMAHIYLNMGFYLGIGGVITFKNSRKLVEVVEKAPIDRIVLETDAPYLAPGPYRGRRNCSVYLKYVIDAVAEIKGITQQEIIDITEKNAKKLYRLA